MRKFIPNVITNAVADARRGMSGDDVARMRAREPVFSRDAWNEYVATNRLIMGGPGAWGTPIEPHPGEVHGPAEVPVVSGVKLRR